MRKLLIAAMTAGLLALAAPAFAGPQGTSDSETNNNVSCGGSATVPVSGTGIKVDTAGDQNGGAAVVCNDAGPAPIQGRVIAAGSTNGGYVAADGDRDNPAQAQGWARVDVDATPNDNVRCGGPDGGGTNAESPGGGSAAYCG